MTEDLMRLLMSAGLTKQQATSVTAETAVRTLMREDGKALIKEAQLQVAEMRSVVNDLKKEYNEVKKKLDAVSGTLGALAEAKDTYGDVSDEKAKNVVALYAALLSMNEKAGASAEDSVRNAGYVVYAYLGGQAKREVTYTGDLE